MVNLTHVGIVGAGQMGGGIAQVCAAAGLDVSLVDVSDAALDRGMAAIAAGLERQVKKGTLSADAKGAMLSRIRTATDHRSLVGAGIVIEAATGEAVIIDGSGVQRTTNSRWGDYTSLNIDPSDDCTFWYVNEYYTAAGQASSAAGWQTRIASFKLPGCVAR